MDTDQAWTADIWEVHAEDRNTLSALNPLSAKLQR
jgi:hypothetical protein